MIRNRDGPDGLLADATPHSVSLSDLRLDDEICCREKLHRCA